MALYQQLKALGATSRQGGELYLLFPAITLAAYWLVGEGAIIALAVAVPLLWLLALPALRRVAPRDPGLGFGSEGDLVAFLDQLAPDASPGRGAAFVVAFDDPARQLDSHGQALAAQIVARTAERLACVLRAGDMLVVLPGGRIGVGLAAPRRLDLEAAIQIAGRLRAAALVPLVEGGLTLHPSISIGLCLGARAPQPGGQALLDAAQAAVDDALLHGPGAIRAHDPRMIRNRTQGAGLRTGLVRALDEGQIRPWFQPQICADTGTVTGMEALARWKHPDRGIIPPGDFLPAVHEHGLSERLGEVILHGALTALGRWDKAGLAVPRVAINLSATELRVPGLPDRFLWEVDRFGLSPARLTVEVLETVSAGTGDEVIVANLSGLARHGFGIDLDDFGTGQASIANLRRFSIRRVKIDRSFVTRVDSDPDQKQIVSGILLLCERLGLETVGEGVETPGEHATLAQLGCTHLQGFGIARPMAVEETFGWLERRLLAATPTVLRHRRGTGGWG